MISILLVLPALLGVCLALQKYSKLPAGAAPLAGLSGIFLVLFLGGIGGVLPMAVWGVVLAGWLSLAVCTWRSAKTKSSTVWRDLLTPAPLLFWGGAVLLVLRLVWLQPAFLNFDEYSFWGAATRIVTEKGVLYPACETGRPWVMTELPGIPLMGSLFQLVGEFSPWKAIFGVDLLILASLTAAVGCCEQKSPRLWGPIALAGVLLPTAMTIPGRTGLVNTTWLEILGDLPAGILFGGAAAFWLIVREQKPSTRWWMLPVLCLAASIKSNTLPLALAAAGLVCLDWVLLPPAQMPHGVRPVLGRIGFAISALAVPMVPYVLWSRYTLPFVLENAATGGMGDTANASLPAVMLNGIKMLLGGRGDLFFEQRRADLFAYVDVMQQAFFRRQVSIFGSGAAVCAVIALVFLLAVFAAPNLRQRLRVVLFALGSTVCFAGYWLMLLLSYAFIFKDSSPALMGLASYSRYMDSYYAGWLLLALAMLAHQAAQGNSLRGFFGALGIAALLAGCTAQAWQPQFTIFGASRNVYAQEAARSAQAAQIRAALEPEDRVFLIRQGDDGFYWFWYAQALMPNILEYGAGGGTYGSPEYEAGQPYYQSCTADELEKRIAESGANCVLTVKTDDIFVKSYAELFTDGLAAAQQGIALYRPGTEGYTPVWTLAEEAAT